MAYKIGLVGCGGMGRSHLNVIREHLPEFEVAALCDPSAEAATKIKEEFDLQVRYQSFEEIYDREELDLVVPHRRGDITRRPSPRSSGASRYCAKSRYPSTSQRQTTWWPPPTSRAPNWR